VGSEPLVSIIMPAYNAERYIRRSIDSALRQTYQNTEIVVVDDGSVDDTAGIVKSYSDGRIIYRYQQNQGTSAARNHGVSICRGEFLAFLDADDQYLPQRVEKSVEFLSTHPKYSIAYCSVLHFFSKNPGKFYRLKHTPCSGDVLEELLRGTFININSVTCRRHLFEKTGFTFTVARFYAEDYEMYLKFALLGYAFGYIDSDLVIVEIRSDSEQHQNSQVAMKQNTIHMLEKHLSIIPEEKRTVAHNTIRSMKRKLAMAHLVQGEREAFVEMLMSLTNRTLRVPAYIVASALGLIPSFMVKYVLEGALRVNRRRHYDPVAGLPPE
jgi:glycosyltransferase involved in cell wall biosynthesis